MTTDRSAAASAPDTPAPRPGAEAGDFAGLADDQVDAGLLVIHGVGSHQQSTTIRAMLDPFLERLSSEGLLVNAVASSVGETSPTKAPFAALLVGYGHAVQAPPSRLLVVEGRWDGSFLKQGTDEISSWVTRSAAGMVFQVLRYHWRRWWQGLGALLVLATLALAVGKSEVVAGASRLGLDLPGWFERSGWYWWGLSALAMALLLSISDAADFLRQRLSPLRRVAYGVAVVGTLLVNQLQYGVVIVVTAVGIVLAPAVLVVLRWLSSIPFLAGAVRGGLLPKAEAALMLGGIGDMEAVVGSPVTAAAIRERLREALILLESRVGAGGVITVVAHSGGGPIAWDLLSDPEIAERQAAKRFRYRLITAGAALNWAKRGFEGRSTPLDRPLVNWATDAHGNATAGATVWWNVYGAWDPVPHGPIRPSDFSGFATEPVDGDVQRSPNCVLRNLGAPVPDEHGEYWRNQQEFIGILGRALDDRFEWAKEAKAEAALFANCRISLLSSLVRTRMVFMALPFVALLAAMRGTRFLPEQGAPADHSRLVRGIGFLLSRGGKLVLGDNYDDFEGFLRASPILVGFLVTVLLLLAALALMDVYTNVCWHRLGRDVRNLRPTTRRFLRRWFPLHLRASLWTWVPVVVVVPLLLWQLPVRESTRWALMAANWAFVAIDVAWCAACVGALNRGEDDDVRVAVATGVGRAAELARAERGKRGR